MNRLAIATTRLRISAMAVLLVGATLSAQTTGSLRVVARDANGKPAVGSRLSLKSLDRGDTRVLVTDAEGVAGTSGLIPGRYRLDGKELLLRPDERVFVTVRIVDAQASVEVEASPLLAETSSVGVQTRFTQGELQSLPFAPHRFVEHSYLAPGITPSGKPEPVVYGSMLDANAFLVDGMSTNLSSTGRFGMNMSTEILESQVITTGGHKAEVGFAAGAVFNLVTRSGGNDFHGALFASRINRGNNARPEAGKTNSPAERPTDASEFGFSFSGPLIKDKLFFFGAFNRQLLAQDFENVQPIGTSPHRRTQSEDRSYRFLKLSWVINENHRMDLSWFGDPVTQFNFDMAGDSSVKDFQQANRTRGGNSFLVKHVGLLGGNLAWENTIGLHQTAFQWSPATLEAGPFRGQLDAAGGESFGRSPEDRLERVKNLTVKSEFTWYFGEHVVKGGLQALNSEFTRVFLRPSGGLSYLDRAAGGAGPSTGDIAAIRSGLISNSGTDFGYANADSLVTPSPVSGQLAGGVASYLYRRTLSDLNEYGNPLKSKTVGLYAQDDYHLDASWTFNLGLRVDKASADGEDGRELYSQTLLSPRLGLSWNPDGRGHTRVFVYFGRIFSPPSPGALRPAGATTDGPSTTQQVWVPSQAAWKIYASAGVVVPKTLAVQPGLKAPSTDLIQVGAQRVQNLGAFMGDWTLDVLYTRKSMKDLVDTYNPSWSYLAASELGLSAFTPGVRVIGNLPGLKRDYNGVDLVAEHAFAGGHWMRFSYTNARLNGNSEVGNVASSSPSNTGFAQIPGLAEDYRQGKYEGPLNEDVRHNFKAYGLAKLPLNLELSGAFNIRSGLHYANLAKVSGNTVLAPGETRGNRELPWARSFDITFAWHKKIHGVDLRLGLDVLNLTNAQPLSATNNLAQKPGNYQQGRVVQFSARAAF